MSAKMNGWRENKEIASSKSPLPIYSSRSVFSDRPGHCHTEGRGDRAEDGTRCGGMGTAGFRRGHVPVRVPRFIPLVSSSGTLYYLVPMTKLVLPSSTCISGL